MLVAVVSGKGGVGKTVTAAALAAGLRELGDDPVLLDLDSGSDLTWSLGFDAADGALDLLAGRRSLAEVAVESAEGLRVVPGSPGLLHLEEWPVTASAERLRAIAKDALLIVDTPPGFGAIVTRAAIAAADVVVVPFVPEPFAERRARHVLDVAGILEVEPVVLAMAVMVDHRRALTGSILAQALEAGLTPCVEIPRSVLIPEAANLGRSVLAYAPRSPVAAAYRIAAEALRRVLK